MSEHDDDALLAALAKPTARAGTGTIDGAVWRPGDPVKHLGPPARLGIHLWSALFSTRCGLEAADGAWLPADHDGFHEDDDCWCPGCLTQAGLEYTLWDDGEDSRG